MVQLRFLAVGSVVPWAEPHVGAVATQAYANPTARGSRAAARGRPRDRRRAPPDRRRWAAREVLLGVVDRRGGSASYTGSVCVDGQASETAPATPRRQHPRRGRDGRRAADTFEATAGGPSRAVPRLRAAASGRAATRREQSASLLSSSRTAGTRASRTSWPISASTTTRAAMRSCSGSTSCTTSSSGTTRRTPRPPWRASSASRSSGGSIRSGTPPSPRWSGDANLELRVDGESEIDLVVLEALRRTPGRLTTSPRACGDLWKDACGRCGRRAERVRRPSAASSRAAARGPHSASSAGARGRPQLGDKGGRDEQEKDPRPADEARGPGDARCLRASAALVWRVPRERDRRGKTGQSTPSSTA